MNRMDFIDAVHVMLFPLTGLNMTIYDGDLQKLTDFEKQFCLIPAVQTFYTSDGLLSFFGERGDDTIYQISEPLDTHLTILQIEKRWIILGPYVTSSWNEAKAGEVLKNNGVQDSALISYKVYHYTFPVLSDEYVARIGTLLLENTTGTSLEIEHLDMTSPGAEQPSDPVGSRGALEGRMIEAVTRGDTREAVKAFKEFRADPENLCFTSPAALCEMVQRFSLEAGLTPVLVDALRQEYSRKMDTATDESALLDLTGECIAAFSDAVHRYNNPERSPCVNQALQYIDLHYNENLDEEMVAEFCGITKNRLIKMFRAEVGRTIKRYIVQTRCEKAAQLLEDTRMPVKEISQYVGIEYTNYFSSIFKDCKGMTPLEYRKRKTFYPLFQ